MKITPLKIEKSTVRLPAVYPALIQGKEQNYLVDCGYCETSDVLLNELHRHGVEASSLHGVILTHDDYDHTEGLAALKSLNKTLKVYCSEPERNSIAGIEASERLLQVKSYLPLLSGKNLDRAMYWMQRIKNVPPVLADVILGDQDTLEDGLTVIHTPGHTRGHISLFDPDSKTLIAGDALVIERDTFNIANPEYTLDMEAALRSVERIKNLEPERVICYHGGTMETDIEGKLEQLLEKYHASYVMA